MSSRLASASCNSATRRPTLVHPPQIGGLLIAVPGRFGRQEALFLDETVEIGARHRPGVTLVLHEAVHDGDGAASAVLLQLDAFRAGAGCARTRPFP